MLDTPIYCGFLCFPGVREATIIWAIHASCQLLAWTGCCCNNLPRTWLSGWVYFDFDVFYFLAATKQLYKWYFLSVRLSYLFDYVPIIVSSWNFQELLPRTGVRSMQKVKVTTKHYRFRTVTPVWIHIWWWNDTYSLTLLRRGALLFFKVIRQISRSHGSKNRRFWPELSVSGL